MSTDNLMGNLVYFYMVTKQTLGSYAIWAWIKVRGRRG